MISGKTIFISPLDWGLGHATRCAPLIKQLAQNNKILLGVTALNRFFFDKHLPGIQKISLPSYNIQYSPVLPIWMKVLLQAPKLNSVVRQENKLLEEIVSQHKIEVVISDNRFGLYHRHTKNIFITHQLHVQSPVFPGFASRINHKLIHRFDEVWVPDYAEPGKRLSGKLGDEQDIKIPINYIGPLSYLQEYAQTVNNEERMDYLLLLSGVEPQRSLLEKKLVNEFKNSGKRITLVRGSRAAIQPIHPSLKTISFADGAELCQLIVNANTVICRSGYSTLMDLHVLNKKKLILIPTPGQTEQEYLAAYWEKKFAAVSLAQDKIKGYNFR